LGWDADPEEEKKPEKVIPRIQAMLGDARPFELEWVSIYTFQCRRMNDFRHGRVLFVGDAAHQVSPFGARGANSGFQDTDALMWKLALVLQGQAPEKLLDSYAQEREFAADENILNSTRSTDFITPKTRTSRHFRNAVLELARDHSFARKLVNSGRLSMPSFLVNSALNTPDTEPFAGDMVPGAPLDDAPVNCNDQRGWLLDQLGQRFQCLYFVGDAAVLTDAEREALRAMQQATPAIEPLLVASKATAAATESRVLHDVDGLMAKRYDARPGTAYLLRPDQHVAARWRHLDAAAVLHALRRATAQA
jgi:3-(3-hydroxy-phenyl)propionate hydroxylase